MRAERDVDVQIDAARARIRDVARWPEWAPGVLAVAPQPEGVRVWFGGPRPFAARIEVTSTDTGTRVDLLEGDLSGLTGTFDAVAVDGGTRLLCAVAIELPLTLPGPLLRELESELPARWLAAWAAAS
jgi:hypothetical protein